MDLETLELLQKLNQNKVKHRDNFLKLLDNYENIVDDSKEIDLNDISSGEEDDDELIYRPDKIDDISDSEIFDDLEAEEVSDEYIEEKDNLNSKLIASYFKNVKDKIVSVDTSKIDLSTGLSFTPQVTKNNTNENNKENYNQFMSSTPVPSHNKDQNLKPNILTSAIKPPSSSSQSMLNMVRKNNLIDKLNKETTISTPIVDKSVAQPVLIIENTQPSLHQLGSDNTKNTKTPKNGETSPLICKTNNQQKSILPRLIFGSLVDKNANSILNEKKTTSVIMENEEKIDDDIICIDIISKDSASASKPSLNLHSNNYHKKESNLPSEPVNLPTENFNGSKNFHVKPKEIPTSLPPNLSYEDLEKLSKTLIDTINNQNKINNNNNNNNLKSQNTICESIIKDSSLLLQSNLNLNENLIDSNQTFLSKLNITLLNKKHSDLALTSTPMIQKNPELTKKSDSVLEPQVKNKPSNELKLCEFTTKSPLKKTDNNKTKNQTNNTIDQSDITIDSTDQLPIISPAIPLEEPNAEIKFTFYESNESILVPTTYKSALISPVKNVISTETISHDKNKKLKDLTNHQINQNKLIENKLQIESTRIDNNQIISDTILYCSSIFSTNKPQPDNKILTSKKKCYVEDADVTLTNQESKVSKNKSLIKASSIQNQSILFEKSDSTFSDKESDLNRTKNSQDTCSKSNLTQEKIKNINIKQNNLSAPINKPSENEIKKIAVEFDQEKTKETRTNSSKKMIENVKVNKNVEYIAISDLMKISKIMRDEENMTNNKINEQQVSFRDKLRTRAESHPNTEAESSEMILSKITFNKESMNKKEASNESKSKHSNSSETEYELDKNKSIRIKRKIHQNKIKHKINVLESEVESDDSFVMVKKKLITNNYLGDRADLPTKTINESEKCLSKVKNNKKSIIENCHSETDSSICSHKQKTNEYNLRKSKNIKNKKENCEFLKCSFESQLSNKDDLSFKKTKRRKPEEKSENVKKDLTFILRTDSSNAKNINEYNDSDKSGDISDNHRKKDKHHNQSRKGREKINKNFPNLKNFTLDNQTTSTMPEHVNDQNDINQDCQDFVNDSVYSAEFNNKEIKKDLINKNDHLLKNIKTKIQDESDLFQVDSQNESNQDSLMFVNKNQNDCIEKNKNFISKEIDLDYDSDREVIKNKKSKLDIKNGLKRNLREKSEINKKNLNLPKIYDNELSEYETDEDSKSISQSEKNKSEPIVSNSDRKVKESKSDKRNLKYYIDSDKDDQNESDLENLKKENIKNRNDKASRVQTRKQSKNLNNSDLYESQSEREEDAKSKLSEKTKQIIKSSKTDDKINFYKSDVHELNQDFKHSISKNNLDFKTNKNSCKITQKDSQLKNSIKSPNENDQTKQIKKSNKKSDKIELDLNQDPIRMVRNELKKEIEKVEIKNKINQANKKQNRVFIIDSNSESDDEPKKIISSKMNRKTKHENSKKDSEHNVCIKQPTIDSFIVDKNSAKSNLKVPDQTCSKRDKNRLDLKVDNYVENRVETRSKKAKCDNLNIQINKDDEKFKVPLLPEKDPKKLIILKSNNSIQNENKKDPAHVSNFFSPQVCKKHFLNATALKQDLSLSASKLLTSFDSTKTSITSINTSLKKKIVLKMNSSSNVNNNSNTTPKRVDYLSEMLKNVNKNKQNLSKF